ncbi:hypothetical protein [Stenotrophomonas panacihumi]|uniref:hypothetical protein n=1 Tax=Stenotrophomonas panacihumi TaxID=676599 RepID=UPI0011B27AD0|nr:hypothetical protein [Stenotrophomonas panacihumi]
MKKWQWMTLVLAAGCATYAAWSEPGRQKFGPVRCVSCLLQEPEPDAATLGKLHEFHKRHNYGGLIGLGEKYQIRAGDVIVICNRNFCVDYERTTNNQWLGNNPRKVQQHVLQRARQDDVDKERNAILRELAEEWAREQWRGQGIPPPIPAPPGWNGRGRVVVGTPSRP